MSARSADELAVLEFDHLWGKKANISDLVSQGGAVESLREEICKCSIVCANCHRRVTTERKRMPPVGLEPTTNTA